MKLTIDRLKNIFYLREVCFFSKKEYDQYKKGGRWMDLIKIGKYIAGKRKSLGDDTKATGRKIRYLVEFMK